MAKQFAFDAYSTDAQKAFAEQAAQMTARMEDVAEFAKGNVDAMLASVTKATDAANELATEVIAFAKTTTDASVAGVKDLSKAKDVNEFVEKQSSLTKASFESFAKQAQKLNEMTLAAVKECAEPVSARVAVVGELAKSSFGK